MPTPDLDRDDEAPVALLVSCSACGAEFPWRVGFEDPDTRCPGCRRQHEAGTAETTP